MRLKSVPFAFVLAVTLAGCATTPPTPYQPFVAYGSTGVHGGFSDQKLAPDRYRVRFHGNSMTSRDRVEGYMLYRAAELTVQNGFDWFVVADRNTEHNVRTIVHRDRLYQPWYGPDYDFWRPDWSFYSSRMGWSSWRGFGSDPWPGAYDVRQIEAFEATADIQMHKGPIPVNEPSAFDARSVIAKLGPTIERPKR